ncbi:nuclear transport factor 2 family protein [Calothrix sp. FACHB-1219]|uniref:nuclear transport factor 2 family protein n=1 Tax=unclassified Calothrix TaxID=2619626 RepID=UPI00168501C8|nr:MULTISPECIES: nuclear transport factor 2 family protein [unclassified Calothrix]MBD2203964.1 nuclear transport factor 2 family protein [Calothrix sp. FACHB-168]MBD2218251.1 nuclear transport factor 2 family protein [Calothrix sp. FACHB-1219]
MEGIKIQQTAQQAFDYLAKGWATGNFQPFIDMLADEVMFWLPVGQQRDTPFGYENKQQLIARFQARTERGDRLIFSQPKNIISNDTSVIVEFETQGTIRNQPFTGNNVISFDIQDDKITGIREYFGEID